MKKTYTLILFFISFTFYAQTNLVLNGTGDELLCNIDMDANNKDELADNADAFDMTPSSKIWQSDGAGSCNELDSPYKAVWNNTDLNTYIDSNFSTNEQPGSTSDGTYQDGSKTRAFKIYSSGRRLYQKITVEAGENYKFSIDSRSEAENIPSEVFILNEEITTEVGLENGATDTRVDHYLNITNDHNTSKGSASDNTFTTSSFTFTASTTTVVIYVRALLAIDGSTEVFYDNISLVKEATASIGDVSAVDVKVYPNPTTGLVNISTNENINSIAVHDLLGRKVLASQTNLETVDVSSLTKGIYLLHLNLEKGQLTKKLIVE